MLDPSLLELAGAALSGGLLSAGLGLLRWKPEKRRLEAEREKVIAETGVSAVELVADALQGVKLAQVEIAALRREIAELTAVNRLLEAEVRHLRDRLTEIESSAA